MQTHKKSLNNFPWIEIIGSLIIILYMGVSSYFIVQDKSFQEIRKIKSYMDSHKITVDSCENSFERTIQSERVESFRTFLAQSIQCIQKNELPFLPIAKEPPSNGTLENLLAYQKQLAKPPTQGLVEEGSKRVIEKELRNYQLGVEIVNLSSWQLNLLLFITLMAFRYMYLLFILALIFALAKLFIEMFVEKSFWQ